MTICTSNGVKWFLFVSIQRNIYMVNICLIYNMETILPS